MIGLLTFHQCHNYGAVLQAYALQQALDGMGVESEFIDIENFMFTEHGKMAGHNLYRRYLETDEKKRQDVEAQLEERWNYFEHFIYCCLKCSRTVVNEEQVKGLLPKYHMLLVGGDQLWNPGLPVATDIFSVPFSCDLHRASYSASLGSSNYISIRKRLFLKKFTSLGIRETSCVPFLNKYVGIRAVQNVDPVFLLRRKKWEELAESCKMDHFCFVYLFNNGTSDFERYIHIIRKYAKSSRQKIVISSNDYVEDDQYITSVISVSPKQWLGYMMAADYIVTNSFHGLAFAILFEKKFLVLDTEIRKKELLRLCELDQKAEESINDIYFAAERDILYEDVIMHLNKMIEKSVDYLKEICEWGKQKDG